MTEGIDTSNQEKSEEYKRLSALIGSDDKVNPSKIQEAFKAGLIDEEELHKLNKELHKQQKLIEGHLVPIARKAEGVDKDHLTGLLNRRGLDGRFEKLISDLYSKSGKRRSHIDSLMVVFFDLDSFKSLNDDYGHRAGDRGLIEFTERLKESVRGIDDVVARTGGDEFVILFPIRSHDKDDTEPHVDPHELIFEHIKNKLKDLSIKAIHKKTGNEDTVYIRASMGHATLRRGEQPQTLEELKNEADKNMYKDKDRRKKKR